MTATAPDDAAAGFGPLRPKLMRVAYRMLGSVSDAEDVVQDAFIRWMGTDRSQVREPEAFLRRTVTRLCLDQLKSTRRQRETYIGPWLPEPIVEEDDLEDVTLPLMLALERLSRSSGRPFCCTMCSGWNSRRSRPPSSAIQPPAASLPLAHGAMSARRGLASRWRSSVAWRSHEAFFAASRSGDMQALGELLTEDVSAHADGGGKRPAALAPVLGFDAVMKQYAQVAAWLRDNRSTLVRIGFVNGLPGFVTREADGELQTTALDIEDGKIAAVYVMRNPDKLRHLR